MLRMDLTLPLIHRTRLLLYRSLPNNLLPSVLFPCPDGPVNSFRRQDRRTSSLGQTQARTGPRLGLTNFGVGSSRRLLGIPHSLTLRSLFSSFNNNLHSTCSNPSDNESFIQ